MHNINTFKGGIGGDWIQTLHRKRLSKKHDAKRCRRLQLPSLQDDRWVRFCPTSACIVNPHWGHWQPCIRRWHHAIQVSSLLLSKSLNNTNMVQRYLSDKNNRKKKFGWGFCPQWDWMSHKLVVFSSESQVVNLKTVSYKESSLKMTPWGQLPQVHECTPQ